MTDEKIIHLRATGVPAEHLPYGIVDDVRQVLDFHGMGYVRTVDLIMALYRLIPEDKRPALLASPKPEMEMDCGCRVIGPLVTAPGTSGRDWHCQSCGTLWPGCREPLDTAR